MDENKTHVLIVYIFILTRSSLRTRRNIGDIMKFDKLSKTVRGLELAVHKELGPGLLENA